METDCHDVVFEIMCMHQIYGEANQLPMRLDRVTELKEFVALSFFYLPVCAL